MTSLNTDKAYSFYKRFIFDYTQDKSAIYADYGFSLQGSVGSKDWEVFAAILMDDRAKPGDGADLMNYEVKSALIGNSFEYQYHKNRGLEKLQADQAVDHIFVARSRNYQDVDVWLVDRSNLIPVFQSWLPELQSNYVSETRQRFRRSVSFGFVQAHGLKLLEIKEGARIGPVGD